MFVRCPFPSLVSVLDLNILTADMRKIFPFKLFHFGGDEVNTGWYESFIFFFFVSNTMEYFGLP